MSPQHDNRPSGDPRCPLCNRKEPRWPYALGQIVGFAVSVLASLALLYWPVRIVAGWFADLIAGRVL